MEISGNLKVGLPLNFSYQWEVYEELVGMGVPEIFFCLIYCSQMFSKPLMNLLFDEFRIL